jgi:hypothetical protein
MMAEFRTCVWNVCGAVTDYEMRVEAVPGKCASRLRLRRRKDKKLLADLTLSDFLNQGEGLALPVLGTLLWTGPVLEHWADGGFGKPGSPEARAALGQALMQAGREFFEEVVAGRRLAGRDGALGDN